MENQLPSETPVSTHSRPKAAGMSVRNSLYGRPVSTHSRPKAAGTSEIRGYRNLRFQHTAARRRLGHTLIPMLQTALCFNTQPPEGGWYDINKMTLWRHSFQHTAARRRLGQQFANRADQRRSFNTQPPEGGWLRVAVVFQCAACGFNTQPPEGGWSLCQNTQGFIFVSTHSRPKAAGTLAARSSADKSLFQHTAARRRLGKPSVHGRPSYVVSTHSRPKAAGPLADGGADDVVSTHSRPKAAGISISLTDKRGFVSTHSRPKAAGNTFIHDIQLP